MPAFDSGQTSLMTGYGPRLKRLLLLVIVVAAAVQGRGIGDAWSHGNHNGWGGAFYSNIARNYVRYGYLATRFAPVISTGDTAFEDRRYYLTHPPLIGLAVSVAFHFFGEHEWSARLVPLAFSLGCILVIYRLGFRIASPETGLVAATLFAFLPAEIVYGAHVDPQGPPVAFFSLLLLLAYEEQRPLLAAGALVLGAGFDWPIHYLAGLLVVHSFVFRSDRRRWAAGLLAASVLLITGLFLYARLVAPHPQQHYLESTAADAFLFWTGIRVPPDRIPGRSIETPTVREWLPRMGSHFDSLFTIPFLGLAAFGAAVHAARRNAGHLWILLSWGLLHVLLFPLGAYVHDYWSIYLAPGLSLAAAEGLRWIAEAAGKRRELFLAGATTALSAFLLAEGNRSVDSIAREPVRLGRVLHALTTHGEGVLALNAVDARDAYYADRAIRDRVNRVSLFEEALCDGMTYHYFVVPKHVYRERSQKPLFDIIRGCPRYASEEFYIFDLLPRSKVPCAIVGCNAGVSPESHLASRARPVPICQTSKSCIAVGLDGGLD